MVEVLSTSEIHNAIRNAARTEFRISIHARQRMDERGFVPDDIRRCLLTGLHNPTKDELKKNTWRYRIEGRTIDGSRIDIAVAINQGVIVVTVINPLR